MAPDDRPASERFDLTAGMDFDVDPGEVSRVAGRLEQAEAVDPGELGTEELARWVSTLKLLEDAAEEARKSVFEPELDDRLSEGERVGDLAKRTGRSTWVEDDEAALEAARGAGADLHDVVSVSVSGLRDALGPEADEYIGESEYSYFRRQP